MRGLVSDRSTNDLCVSWQRLHRETLELVRLLKDQGPFDGLLAVSRGGLAPAAIVARALEIRRVDVIAVTSYQGRERTEPRIIKETVFPPDGRWLIVDDIADTGQTLALLRGRFPNAITATVFAKPAGRERADYFGSLVEQNVWVVFPWDQEGVEPPGGD